MRAVAVTLVVLCHVGLAAFSGGYVGVDVFFVISGFLITTLLVKELSHRGTISLARFYARRATRLLPASTLALVATLVASWLWLPATRLRGISVDALTATFYGINWRLAVEGVDYLNANATPSPLQHFWSLAVEEQFYLVWPVLLLVIAWLWRRRAAARTPIVVALLVIVIASLIVSVYQTARLAPIAYFGSHTRAWELGTGALVAMAAPALTRTPKVLAALLTWAGLGAVLAAALVFDNSTAFPGYAATLPVLGAAAIIGAGSAVPRAGAGSLLSTWPFRWIGRLSYSWYLWHWPVLMIGPSVLNRAPSVKVNLALAAGSLVLAAASYHLVENPVRTLAWVKARTLRGLAVGLSLSASAAALALLAVMFPPSLKTGQQAPDLAAALNAATSPEETRIIDMTAAASRGVHPLPDNLTPALTAARGDLPLVYAAGCHVEYLTVDPPPCVFGDVKGKQTVYLIGDSHMAQWFPAFDLIAKQRGWRLISLTKNICQVPSVRIFNVDLKRPYDECVEFRDKVIDRIRADRPAMVVMSSASGDVTALTDAQGNQISRAGLADDDLWLKGWQTTFDRIKNPATKLVVLQDTAWPDSDAPACAAQHPRNVNACDATFGDAVEELHRRNLVATAARSQGITVIDPIPWMCAATCPIIVGNVLVYKDNSHISTVWAKLLAPVIATKLPAI